MTTDGVQRNLSACHLAIVDVPALQAGSLSLDDLTAILDESDVPHIASIDFLANPQTHLDWVRRNAREGKSKRGFSPRVVALLSFAGSGGGIGKTTLALQAARRFRQKTGLPALVGEFCFGASGLSALTVEDAPHLYELLSNNEAPAQWKDISLAPLDYAMARLRRKQDYADWYGRQKRRHTLTILDITWPHDLFAGEDIIDQWLILAHAGRRDTIFSALRLKELLTGEGRKVDILVNFYHRGDGLFLSGV
ncbi:MAG TPA: hypothetical protein ENK24_06325, partial [Anaerolineae bacterium]|nr:hypothetical protein [Anaerolineae bacterium]